jgi:hypothetical protein
MAKFGALGIVALLCAGVIGAVLAIFKVQQEIVYVIIAGFALLLMPIFSSLTRRRLRAMGHKSFKVWAFWLPILPAGSIRKRARSLGDEELLGAWHQADHTQKAKEVIAEELRARGLNDAQIVDWRPPAAQLTVRLPMHAIKPDRYFRTVRIRQGLFRVYRVSTGVVLILATIAFALTSSQHVNAPTTSAASRCSHNTWHGVSRYNFYRPGCCRGTRSEANRDRKGDANRVLLSVPCHRHADASDYWLRRRAWPQPRPHPAPAAICSAANHAGVEARGHPQSGPSWSRVHTF